MKVWLFDIDGTLIASGGAGTEATFAALSAAFGVPVRRAGIAFAGRTDRAIAADVFQVHGIDNTAENWERFRKVYLQQLQQQLLGRQGEVLRGVSTLLERLLQESDHHLGLLTGNIREGAEHKLRHYRLWQHFRFGGFGDWHVSRDDVARESLTAARTHLARDIDPHDVWIVGDTVHDVRCARAIGARVIAVATGGSSLQELEAARPDVLVRDLTEDEELLSLVSSF